MKIFSKKSKETSCGGTERRTHDLWRWRKIGTAALCAALVFTTIGGGLITASAIGDLPAAAENESVSAAEAAAGSEAAESEAAKQGPADTETAASETPDTEPAEATPTKDESTKPETTEPSGTESDEKDAVYTLHLTHYLRFTVDGESRHVQTDQTIKLTEADFKDGQCDLNRFAYDAEQLMVTEANPVSLDAFDKDRQAGARIVYAVNSGWKLVPAEENIKGVALRNVFQGTNVDDYEFEPAKVVRLNVEYKYSNTGGLAGIDAASPQMIEGLPEAKTTNDGKTVYEFEFDLPVVSGFRIVLNPTPLNNYLVNPPTGDETPEQLLAALERGDFDVDINENVYYKDEQGNSSTNPTYHNIYSDEYNQAWNDARLLTAEKYSAQAYCGDTGHQNHEIGNHGANPLENPKLKVTLTEAQLTQIMSSNEELSLTVHYRRNATWYRVKHWVPESFAQQQNGNQATGETKTEGDTTYVLMETERKQGRVGALTRAAAKTDGVFALLTPLGFAQKIIESTVATADEGDSGSETVIDIYYKAADSYRVIFDTNYTYIPRLQVNLNENVDFGDKVPERKGYTFAGWKYLKKNAEKNEQGEYDDDQYIEVKKGADEQYELKITEELIAQKAQLKETGGVLALHLYPIWAPAQTQVTVVLWTEDLTGIDDVQATAEGGNTAYYNEKYKDFKNDVETHSAVPGQNNNHYSNVKSFQISVPTDSSLLEDPEKENKKLSEAIQNKVNEEFKNSARSAGDIDASNFYTQDSFEIMHETDDGMDYNVTTADADGKTMIYVYFTRNIYTLQFHYYDINPSNSKTCIATGTNGFSYGGPEAFIKDGTLNFYFTDSYFGGNGSGATNNSYCDTNKEMPVPKTITIKAKYGADLREIWPAARNEEKVIATNNSTYRMVSWATTQGKYRKDAKDNKTSTHYGEPTIMGLFATMDEEIIADPADSNTIHHLFAYWWNEDKLSHYRYNHCFELPGLEITEIANRKEICLYSDTNSPNDLKNILYLIPKDTGAITKFGFTDLMNVSYDEGSNTIKYNDPNGNYYAVRGYKVSDDNEIKYYAIGRQVEVVSSNRISVQNPSARLHMNRVNTSADHTTKHLEWHGQTWTNSDVSSPVKCGEENNPYDLYFYYDRETYTITYKVATNKADSTESEIELGHITLPFGAYVSEEDYAFNLDCHDTNQATIIDESGNNVPKYLWSYPKEDNRPDVAKAPVSVCPDRAENGTADWKFKGWGLGPLGVNMQWTIDETDESTPQAQADENFYIDSNLDLYAIWQTPTYDVTFHLNGGVVDSRDNLVVTVPANTSFTASGS